MPWQKANSRIKQLVDSDIDIDHHSLFTDVLHTVGLQPDDRVQYFAYGSQIWAPCFAHRRQSVATVDHLMREYCILSYLYRGTDQHPGLVLGLQEQIGAQVQGMVFDISAQDLEPIFAQEMVTNVYYPAWVVTRSHSVQESLGEEIGPDEQRALTFIARSCSNHCVRLSLAQQADLILSAEGARGTSLAYFQKTQVALHQAGVPDDRLTELEQLINRRLAEQPVPPDRFAAS
ncbi:gamma-glutamylcyclotransferase [Reinekea sp.]|jgi:cation transport protein ChaC|uniref:gamma-glutamylcyclotransferase n=1 Tax=Reinekea sp. TaxID=1970455 RepID=UPI002A8095EF|nr:gamma-glutamylcyclotransferase [Reinekea sp.]